MLKCIPCLADEAPVPVANCNSKEYNANPKQVMPFKEFIHYWKEYIQNGHSSPKGCLYLKDWHMSRFVYAECDALQHSKHCYIQHHQYETSIIIVELTEICICVCCQCLTGIFQNTMFTPHPSSLLLIG